VSPPSGTLPTSEPSVASKSATACRSRTSRRGAANCSRARLVENGVIEPEQAERYFNRAESKGRA